MDDCSGKFETTTSVYTDIIEVGDSVLETTWSLIDPTDLILKLSSYKELTANQQTHPRGTPTCPSRFHRTPIHTILDERLAIFEVFPDTKPSIFWV